MVIPGTKAIAGYSYIKNLILFTQFKITVIPVDETWELNRCNEALNLPLKTFSELPRAHKAEIHKESTKWIPQCH